MADSEQQAPRESGLAEEIREPDSERSFRSSAEDVQHGGSVVPHRGLTLWRWPSEPTKLPRYVRADFRLKTFALMSMQCLAVFFIMACVDLVLTTAQQRAKVPWYLCLILQVAVFAVLVTMHHLRKRYPLNYAIFAVFTCLVGVSWAFAGNVVATHVHFQLLGILCTAMCVATAVQVLDPWSDLDGWQAAAAPLFAGWAAGCIAMVLLNLCLGDALGGAGELLLWTIVAVLVSFFQFVVVLFDMRRALETCNPDGFMKAIISMDSTLFVIVSCPLILIASFFAKLMCVVVSLDVDGVGEQPEGRRERQDDQQAGLA